MGETVTREFCFSDNNFIGKINDVDIENHFDAVRRISLRRNGTEFLLNDKLIQIQSDMQGHHQSITFNL